MKPKGAVIRPDTFDEVVVQRLMRGQRERARTVDYQEAIIRLARRHYSDGQIAHVLGKTRESVQRIRARRGCPPALPYGSNQFSLITHVPTRHRSLK